MDTPLLKAPASAPQNYQALQRREQGDNFRQVGQEGSQTDTTESVSDSESEQGPHYIAEKAYRILDGADLNQPIIVPNVSRCAAIKCSVMSDGVLIRSITFHSDGTGDSIKVAREIGGILEKPVANKSISILMVTNGPSGGAHDEVLTTITGMVSIRCHLEAVELDKLYGSTDINMTGTHDEVRDHAIYSQRPGYAQQVAQRRVYFKTYNDLCEKAQKRGMDSMSSPHYVEIIPKEDRPKLSYQDLYDKNGEIEKKIKEYDEANGCTCTIL